jgi:hypothetical protein
MPTETIADIQLDTPLDSVVFWCPSPLVEQPIHDRHKVLERSHEEFDDRSEFDRPLPRRRRRRTYWKVVAPHHY